MKKIVLFALLMGSSALYSMDPQPSHYSAFQQPNLPYIDIDYEIADPSIEHIMSIRDSLANINGLTVYHSSQQMVRPTYRQLCDQEQKMLSEAWQPTFDQLETELSDDNIDFDFDDAFNAIKRNSIKKRKSTALPLNLQDDNSVDYLKDLQIPHKSEPSHKNFTLFINAHPDAEPIQQSPFIVIEFEGSYIAKCPRDCDVGIKSIQFHSLKYLLRKHLKRVHLLPLVEMNQIIPLKRKRKVT